MTLEDILWNKKCIYCGGRVFSRTHWNETLWEQNAQISLEGYKCHTCERNILKEEMVELDAPLKATNPIQT